MKSRGEFESLLWRALLCSFWPFLISSGFGSVGAPLCRADDE